MREIADSESEYFSEQALKKWKTKNPALPEARYVVGEN